MNPKVTVVTVCYNCEKDIERTIKSVLSQTYPNIEYIIIDGASKDHTMNIVNQYADKITKIISEPDKGIYDAMNKGIQCATGDWINFMNVGDIFHSQDTIEEVFRGYVDNGESLIYGQVCVVDRKHSKITHQGYSALDYMPAHHQSIFTRTLEMKAHPFNLKYKIIADAAFFYGLYKRNKKQYKVPTFVSDYDDSGLSSVNINKLEQEKLMLYIRHWDIKRVLNSLYNLFCLNFKTKN